ncbi:MAG: RNA 2',3'-cyclic phosphodiesterase [Candidatus Zixiibacteriota bacterium]
MYRLFVAIDLPDQIKQGLTEICNGLPGAKWVDQSQMHITLKFIGEVDGAVFRDAREALATIRLEPFEITIKGTGYFPPRGDPQVLWAGVDGNDRLKQLRNKVETTLVRAGLEHEKRKFAPHVGLAKIRETPPGRLATYLSQYGLFRLPSFEVREFCLFSSFLSSERAIHQIEETYPLGKTQEQRA